MNNTVEKLLQSNKVSNYFYQRYHFKNEYLKGLQLEPDRWYFNLYHHAGGDVYLICSLLKEFQNFFYKGAKITLLIRNPKFTEIIRLFDTDIEIIEFKQPFPEYTYLTEFGPGRIINFHHFHFMPHINKILGYNNFTYFDLNKVLLDLPMDTQPDYPVNGITAETAQYAEDLFRKVGLRKGKTIIFSPEAYSIAPVGLDFWKTLTTALKDSGFDLALMSFGDTYDSLGIPKITFGYKYAIAVTNYAGFLVAARSGFCDITSTSTAQKIMLYPDDTFQAGPVIASGTLKQMNPGHNDTLHEIVYPLDAPATVIGRIKDIIQANG